MPKSSKYEVYLTGTARRDLSGVMEWSIREFGERAALRYGTLFNLETAVRRLA